MMRILSAVVVLALLLSSGVAAPATALGEVAVSIKAPGEVASGGNLTATVDISQVENFDAANYDVSFNSTILRLNNVTSGNIGATSIPIDIWNEISVGTFTIVQNVFGLSGGSGSGYLAVLHFSVIGSPGQSTNISLSNGTLASILAQEIPTTWLGDSVSVTGAIIPGDADSNGVVNVLDLTRVVRTILLLEAETPGADANLDSVVDVLDLTKIVRIILMLG